MAIKRTRKPRPRKYFTSSELKKYIPLFDRNGVGGSGGINPAIAALTDIRINTDTGLAFDAKGNMNPVINQVPVFEATSSNDIAILSSRVIIDYDFILKLIVYSTDTVTNKILIGGQTSGVRGFLVYNASGVSKSIRIYITYTEYAEWTNIDLNGEIVIEKTGVNFTLNGAAPSSSTYVSANSFIDYLFNRDLADLALIAKYAQISLYNKSTGEYVFNYKTQHFTGNKIYDSSGNGNHGIISGSGSWWTRADGIPSMNQSKGFKLVSLDSGTNEAYIPLAVSDATLTTDLTAAGHTVDSITELTQDGTSFLADGSELDLHPTTSDLVVESTDLMNNGDCSVIPDLNGISIDSLRGVGSIENGTYKYQANNIDSGTHYININSAFLSDENRSGKIKFKFLVFIPSSNSFYTDIQLVFNDSAGYAYSEYFNVILDQWNVIEYEYDVSGFLSRTFIKTNYTGITDDVIFIDDLQYLKLTTLSDYLDSIDEVGEELAVNGGFDADLNNWVDVNDYWDWLSGKAYHPAGIIHNPLLQDVLTIGKSYIIEFDTTVISGGVKFSLGDTDGVTDNVIDANIQSGKYSVMLDSVRYNCIIFNRANTAINNEFYIDNVSVKEVTTTDNPFDINAVIAGETILPTENFKYSLLKNPLGDNHSGIVGEFDGSATTHVDLGGLYSITNGDITFSAIIRSLPSSLNIILLGDANNYIAFTSATNLRVRSNGVINDYMVPNITLGKANYRINITLSTTLNIRVFVNDIESVTGVKIFNSPAVAVAYIGAKGYFTANDGYLYDVNLNNQAIYPLSGDVIDTVSQLPATNNGVTFTSLNKVTKGIKLLKP